MLHSRELAFGVYGGGDDDRIAFHCNDTDVTFGSTLAVDARGSFGNDTISIGIDGEVDGKFAVSASSERDDDTISFNILLDDGSTGSLKGVMTGDQENDNLRFAVRQATGSHADVDALMDGGFGMGGPITMSAATRRMSGRRSWNWILRFTRRIRQ